MEGEREREREREGGGERESKRGGGEGINIENACAACVRVWMGACLRACLYEPICVVCRWKFWWACV